MMAYAFVLLPILAYLPFFFVETWASFQRIGKKTPSSDNYLHLTWEMTHTLLIVGVNYFIWLFASVIVDVGKAVYWGLITAGALYIVRAILYVYIYYGSGAKKKLHNGWADWLFAITHLLIIACLLYVVIRGAVVLMTTEYTVNTQFLPWMYPGLVFMIIICAIPLIRIYKIKR
jgi:hypothetical protein